MRHHLRNNNSSSWYRRWLGTRERKFFALFLVCIVAWVFILVRVPAAKQRKDQAEPSRYGFRPPVTPFPLPAPVPFHHQTRDVRASEEHVRNSNGLQIYHGESWVWDPSTSRQGLGHERLKSIVDENMFPVEVPPKPDSFYLDSQGKPQTLVVLMWDGMTPFGWAEGPSVGLPNYAGYVVNKDKCPVDCIWTTDRELIHGADTVLFDVCLTGPYEYREVPVYLPEKRPNQTWGWFAYEQQYYFPLLQEAEYMSRFDYSFSYRYDSLEQITFTCPWGLLNTFLDPPPKKSKDKLVVFMGSNCNTGGAKERTAYIAELSKYIKVDSYGGCLHNTDMQDYQKKNGRRSHGDKITEKIGIISEYKFLLAFENNNKVEDYVTEKMTNAYQAGTVPVYWGSPTVDRWTIGDHSIIKTVDYKSPKELAEYLLKLDEDDEAYNEYFAWKKKGISPQYQRLLDKCLFHAECRLCKKLVEIRNNSAPAPPEKITPHEVDDTWALQMNCMNCRLNVHDQYAEIRSTKAIDLTDRYTITAWINVNIMQDGRIVDKAAAGAINGYSFDILKQEGGPNSKLRLCAASQCFTSERLIHPGIWYHVAVVFENKKNGVNFFINGKHDSSHTPSGPTEKNNIPLRFGRAGQGGGSWRPYHQSTVFDGIIDDVSIWNEPLHEDYIFDLMYTRLTGNENGLVGYWGFNEGVGSVAHDSSPNQLHANLIGEPQWIYSISKPLNDPSNLER